MRYQCADERRRIAARAYNTPDAAGRRLNGLDFVEVEDGRTELRVRFLKPLDDPAEITPDKITITGGERIAAVAVTAVAQDAADELTLTVAAAGDFSTYRLALDAHFDRNWFDPRLTWLDFNFRVDCLAGPCGPEPPGPPTRLSAGGPDYLAKDYASFRRLMLDRLAALDPAWQARSEADLGLALVELLAYAGDYLSYRQDAIAAEAYLDTARLRSSVRRHARLVDYPMHDGCNARAWVTVRVDAVVNLPAGTQFITQLAGAAPALQPGAPAVQNSLAAGAAESYQALYAASLSPDQNRMDFYTWGDSNCVLPAGATRGVLLGSFPGLHRGDVLVLAELRQPGLPGTRQDDLGRCHAVRLAAVGGLTDPLGPQLARPNSVRRGPNDPGQGNDPLALTEIVWGAGDALPFDMRVGSGGSDLPAAVVFGNVVLADHGRWLADEELPSVPPPAPALPRQGQDPAGRLPRYRPRLAARPLTCAAAYAPPDPAGPDPLRPAAADLESDPQQALPAVQLVTADNAVWQPRRDLLASDGDDQGFVVELEADGTAHLRFGDGVYGACPPAGTRFTARVRVGNGVRGNAGAGAVAHVVTTDANLLVHVAGVNNPLPAAGGCEPESVDTVRRRAPYAYRRQERAVLPEDYAVMARRHPEVQAAAAELRWTGSWYTVFLAVDRRGGGPIDAAFETRLRTHLERYRMAGHDIEIVAPQFVALEVGLAVCLARNASRSAVEAGLRRRLVGPGGFFDPDRLTFNQPVYLSALYAALHDTPGLDSVEVTRFERMDAAGPAALAEGAIRLEGREIARLAGDPNNPEHGVLRISLEGGL